MSLLNPLALLTEKGRDNMLEDPTGLKSVGDLFEGAWDEYTGRGYATGEREAAQRYQSEEAAIARQFADQQRQHAERFSSAEAVAARQHQEYMARNQVGMRMESMRAAGINPMLAADLGGAVPPAGPAAHSSAPSVPQAHGVSPGTPQKLAALGEIVGIAKLAAEVRKINASAKLDLSNAETIDSMRGPTVERTRKEVERVLAETAHFQARTKTEQSTVYKIASEIDLLRQQIDSAESEAAKQRVMRAWFESNGKQIELWSDALGIKVRDLIHVFGAIVGVGKFGAAVKAGKTIITPSDAGFKIPAPIIMK